MLLAQLQSYMLRKVFAVDFQLRMQLSIDQRRPGYTTCSRSSAQRKIESRSLDFTSTYRLDVHVSDADQLAAQLILTVVIYRWGMVSSPLMILYANKYT